MLFSSYSVDFKIDSPSKKFYVGQTIPLKYQFKIKKSVKIWLVRVVLTCVEVTVFRYGESNTEVERVKSVKISQIVLDHQNEQGQVYEPGTIEDQFPFLIDPKQAKYDYKEERCDTRIGFVLHPFPNSTGIDGLVNWNLKFKVIGKKVNFKEEKFENEVPKEKSFGKVKVILKGNLDPFDPLPIQSFVDPFQRFADQFSYYHEVVREKEKNYTFVSGKFKVKCWLEKDFYWSGEEVVVKCQVLENSGPKINSVSFQFIRQMKLICNGAYGEKNKTLLKKRIKLNNKNKTDENQYQGSFTIKDFKFRIEKKESSFRGNLANRLYKLRIIFHSSAFLAFSLKLKLGIIVLDSSNPLFPSYLQQLINPITNTTSTSATTTTRTTTTTSNLI